MDKKRPLVLLGERVWRPFVGGRELERLHGARDPHDGHYSEEWLLSTTRASLHASGNSDAGLSRIADGGAFLRDLIKHHPETMLGEKHAARFGAETGILVKFLDARDRLAIQVHPDRRMAEKFFSSAFGKTECWHIIGLRDDSPMPPCLWLGFRPGVTREMWREMFMKQDVEAMLASLHQFFPNVGDTFIVPGGVPHAIGGGCFIAELQEATDLTLRTERVLPSGVKITEEECCLGIGVDGMMDCFHFDGLDEESAKSAYRLDEWRRSDAGHGVSVVDLVDGKATDCFAMQGIAISNNWRVDPHDSFSGFCVIAGTGRLEWEDGVASLLPASQVFIPAACPGCRIVNTGDGVMRLLRFFGPETG